MAVIQTPITDLFKIKHPIILAGKFSVHCKTKRCKLKMFCAGMNVAAGPELAAAVTNAGGLGVIGGLGYTPKVLRQQVRPVSRTARIPEADVLYRFRKLRKV